MAQRSAVPGTAPPRTDRRRRRGDAVVALAASFANAIDTPIGLRHPRHCPNRMPRRRCRHPWPTPHDACTVHGCPDGASSTASPTALAGKGGGRHWPYTTSGGPEEARIPSQGGEGDGSAFHRRATDHGGPGWSHASRVASSCGQAPPGLERCGIQEARRWPPAAIVRSFDRRRRSDVASCILSS
jgi:hypothetical protein